jgi:hypothetical protein
LVAAFRFAAIADVSATVAHPAVSRRGGRCRWLPHTLNPLAAAPCGRLAGGIVAQNGQGPLLTVTVEQPVLWTIVQVTGELD